MFENATPVERALLMAIRRQIFLNHGRVLIECPRLMTDAELAKVLAAFAEEVTGRPEPPPPPPASRPEPSRLPHKMRPPKRWR